MLERGVVREDDDRRPVPLIPQPGQRTQPVSGDDEVGRPAREHPHGLFDARGEDHTVAGTSQRAVQECTGLGLIVDAKDECRQDALAG